MADPLWEARDSFAALEPRKRTAFLIEVATKHADDVASALAGLSRTRRERLLRVLEAEPELLFRMAVELMRLTASTSTQKLLAEEADDVLSRYAGTLVAPG